MKDFSIAYYLPKKTYTNEEFFGDFPDEKIDNYLKLGIESRHIVEPYETASDIAFAAAKLLLDSDRDLLDNVEHILFCTQELDFYTPSTAVTLQHRLKLQNNCSAFDFNHGCAGFTYGLFLAKSMLLSSKGTGALFLTGYTLTKVLHPGDKSSRFLFGDAGTATFISQSFVHKIGKFVFKTYGEQYEAIIVRDGFARQPINDESHRPLADHFGNITSRANFSMNGIKVFTFAIRTIPGVAKEILKINNLQLDQIDLFVFHQANAFILESLAKKMKISKDKMVIDLAKTGNTGQSSIPIVLSHLIKEDQLEGKIVMLIGFGTGLSVAGTVIKY